MVLKQKESLTVQIEGHTDNVGDPRINETLGEYRARVTYQYLLKSGIDSKRLTWVSHGGSKPTTPNNNESNKKKNRRVEIIYKKN